MRCLPAALAFAGAAAIGPATVYPHCHVHDGAVHAMCGSTSVGKWDGTPENGNAQAIVDCEHASQTLRRWPACPAGEVFGSQYGPLYIYDSTGAEVTDPAVDLKLRKLYWHFKENEGGFAQVRNQAYNEMFMADALKNEFGYTFSKHEILPTPPPTPYPTVAATNKLGHELLQKEHWQKLHTETDAEISEQMAKDSEYDKALAEKLPNTEQAAREQAFIAAGGVPYRGHHTSDSPEPIRNWYNRIKVTDVPAVNSAVGVETSLHAGQLFKTMTNHKVREQIVATGGTEGTYDADGTYQPPMRTNYDPQSSLKCCVDRCTTLDASYFASGSRADCKIGCGLWLSKSSLNWESTKWWPSLNEKCKKDCKQHDITINGHDPFARSNNYWTNDQVQVDRAPTSPKECQFGCEQYFKCL